MKLLVCASEYYPHGSGIANVAYHVVEQLKKMGIDCTVCSPTGPDIKLGNYKLIEKTGIVGLLHYWQKVSKYFKDSEYDVIWVHNPLFFENAPFQRGLITIHTTYHGMAAQKLNPKIYYKISSKIEKYSLNKISEKTVFTGVSLQVCNELREMGINKERITFIPNGVDTHLFSPSNNVQVIRKKFGIPEDGLIILSLGRLTDAKQPYKLIEVFSLIEKKMRDVSLVIAGKGEFFEKAKYFAKKQNLKNIRFLGHIDHQNEAPDLYACSDYYVLASKYEGQPLTLLEAMSSGLPCIVSDIPSLRIVEHANGGIIIDFSNEEQAAEDIIKYLDKNNSAHSNNSRNFAKKEFDWQIIAKRYLEEFRQIRKKEGYTHV